MRGFVAFVQVSQRSGQHTVFGHGVDEPRRGQHARQRHGRHGDDGHQGCDEHDGRARHRVGEDRDRVLDGVAVHHVPIGVHHTHHDVGDDGVEQRCDEQGLDHAAWKVRFGIQNFAADGTNFDGAGEGNEHERSRRAHAEADGLEILDGSTGIKIAGKQRHDAQHDDHGHGPRDDGNLNFLDGLDAREVNDQNEHKKNHSNRIGVDVVDAEVFRDHGHVGCKPDQRKGGLQHEGRKQAQSTDRAHQMTVGSFGVDVKSTRLRHGTGQLRFGKRTGDDDATGEQKGEPHARSRHFLRKGGEEKKTGPQHGGKRKNHQCFQADAAGQLNSFLDDHSNSPDSGKR